MIGGEKNDNGEECDEGKKKWKCPPMKNVTHPLRYYELTPEEMKALEECDRDSFYQRCLPLSTLFAAITYVGVKNGFLRRNPHFGAVPKLLLATLVGYACGRISYLSECQLRLCQLPRNSHLGNVMRQYHLENNPPKNSKTST